MVYYANNYLEHHGISGQKWGKKNGPPYPLDAEDHSASEKRAGWKKSIEGNSDYQNAKADREKKQQMYKGAKASGASKEEVERLKQEFKDARTKEGATSVNARGEYLSKRGENAEQNKMKANAAAVAAAGLMIVHKMTGFMVGQYLAQTIGSPILALGAAVAYDSILNVGTASLIGTSISRNMDADAITKYEAAKVYKEDEEKKKKEED